MKKRKNNEANTKLDFLKNFTSVSDALSVISEINTHLNGQKEASKDLGHELQKKYTVLSRGSWCLVYAKLSAFFEIERENVSSSSHESDEVAIKPRKELQEHKEEKMTAKIVADAKQENLGK